MSGGIDDGYSWGNPCFAGGEGNPEDQRIEFSEVQDPERWNLDTPEYWAKQNRKSFVRLEEDRDQYRLLYEAWLDRGQRLQAECTRLGSGLLEVAQRLEDDTAGLTMDEQVQMASRCRDILKTATQMPREG